MGGKIPTEGVQMHPLFLFFRKPCSRAASEEYSLNDRQGGARGFIVKRVWGASLFCITLIGKGELLISIMSSLAQEESRSISENVTWGHRKRFADGKVCVPFGHFLGYDRGPDGNLVVNREQAKTVKLIYRAGQLRNGRLQGHQPLCPYPAGEVLRCDR